MGLVCTNLNLDTDMKDSGSKMPRKAKARRFTRMDQCIKVAIIRDNIMDMACSFTQMRVLIKVSGLETK